MPVTKAAPRGFSLVELLVSLATGLFLLSGVMGIFSATLSSQGNVLKTTRLNQELRNIIDLISRDVRRAGYWGLAVATGQPEGSLTLSGTSGSITVTSSGTPFGTLGSGVIGRTLITDYGAATITAYTSASTVSATVTRNFSTTTINEGSWMLSNLFAESANDLTVSGSCIQYTYDRDGDSTVDADEKFAFRLNSGVVQMYPGSGTAPVCSTGVGTWEDLSSDSITITELTFSLADTECINLSAGGTDCGSTAPASGDVLTYIREVDIVLTGALANDSSVSRSLTETVRLRNDKMAVY